LLSRRRQQGPAGQRIPIPDAAETATNNLGGAKLAQRVECSIIAVARQETGFEINIGRRRPHLGKRHNFNV